MESRLRVSGQAVQPVLIMFPLGLFAMAVFFDLATLLGAPDILGALGYWNIVAGLVGGVLTALAVAIDLMFVPNGTRAKRTGVLLALINMGVLILFAVILMVRMRTTDLAAGGGVLPVRVVGPGAAGLRRRSGGELGNPRPARRFARAE